jgi:FkbM family methyltransferase
MNVRSNARSLIRRAFASIALSRTTEPLYNWVFERSPCWLANVLNRLQTQPSFDLVWKTRLLNGHTIRISVRADNPRSWEFSHAYHWHDVGIRNLEHVLFSMLHISGKELVFIDIGANMGVRSLLPLSMGIHSVLFEPNRALREFSEELFRINKLDDYEIINVCLSNFQGSAQFYVSENSYMSSLNRGWLRDGGEVTEIEVEVTTLDDWISGRPDIGRRAAIVKIDVEGAEFPVLCGARRFIAERRPELIVEVAGHADNRKRVSEFCREIGYQIFLIKHADHLVLESVDPSRFIEDTTETNFFLTDIERGRLDARR